MADENWGRCKDCRHFSPPGQEAGGDGSVGRCKQAELKQYSLAVSANSGCNVWEARIAPSDEIAPPPVH